MYTIPPLRHFGFQYVKELLFLFSTIPLYFKECLLKNVLELFSQNLYARWDSNPQPRRARLLRPLCIPNSTTRAYIQRTINRPPKTRTMNFLVGTGILLYYTNDLYKLHVLKDSNPRGPCDPNGFGDHLFQPLTQARIFKIVPPDNSEMSTWRI